MLAVKMSLCQSQFIVGPGRGNTWGLNERFDEVSSRLFRLSTLSAIPRANDDSVLVRAARTDLWHTDNTWSSHVAHAGYVCCDGSPTRRRLRQLAQLAEGNGMAPCSLLRSRSRRGDRIGGTEICRFQARICRAGLPVAKAPSRNIGPPPPAAKSGAKGPAPSDDSVLIVEQQRCGTRFDRRAACGDEEEHRCRIPCEEDRRYLGEESAGQSHGNARSRGQLRATPARSSEADALGVPPTGKMRPTRSTSPRAKMPPISAPQQRCRFGRRRPGARAHKTQRFAKRSRTAAPKGPRRLGAMAPSFSWPKGNTTSVRRRASSMVGRPRHAIDRAAGFAMHRLASRSRACSGIHPRLRDSQTDLSLSRQ